MIRRMFVIDSDLIIDLLRGVPQSQEFFNKIKSREYMAYFSTISETEIFSGQTASTPNDQNILEDLFEIMNRIDVDKKIARKAGELRRKFGCSIPDAIIAASAIVNKFTTVATRNIKHYEKIRDLKVFTPY